MFRRGSILLAVSVAAALALAGAALGGKPGSVPISFDLDSATCPQLPAGTTIHGEGTGTVLSVTASGNVHSQIRGTATDGAGTTWQFAYNQNIQVGADGTAQVVDHFNLVGSGTPIRLHSHFVIVFDANFDPVDIKQVTGDSINCDPL